MSPITAVTTESALIGAFACVIAAVLLRQVTAPGRSLVWSRQATVLALVPTGGAATLLVLFCYDIVGITSLINALVLGASLLLAVSFTSTVEVELDGGDKALPDAAALMHLVKTRRSIFPKDFSGEEVPRAVLLRVMEAANWAPTHGKTEPWRFVVLSTPESMAALQAARQKATERLLKDAPDKLDAALTKMARKAGDAAKVGALIALCVKRVINAKGSLMPEWEETAAVSCAVQNLHLMLTCEGYAGYWSSGGVAGDCAWANSDEVREMLGMACECQGEPDRVLGFFHVGAVTPEGAAKYRGRRGALDDKVAWNPM